MQHRFEGLDPRYRIEPDPHRSAPAVWVKRVRVLRELAPGDEHIVRDVELRRGLNIVWAPPEPADGQNALFRSGVAGHTAGKTTLCRLIRYALGESTFAPESTKGRIREKLPTGWVVAEVIVSDAPWAVARPFRIGDHPFCIEGGDADSAVTSDSRTEYQAFLSAVAAATADLLPVRHFPTRDESVEWNHLLPWLTRDQECRFAHLLEWRDSASDSGAPFLIVDERQFVVRSTLGLITAEERDEQQRNARLVAQKQAATASEPVLAAQAGADHGRIGRLWGVELPPLSSGVFGSRARIELDRRSRELDDRFKELEASDERTTLRTVLDRRLEEMGHARSVAEQLRADLQRQHAAVSQLHSEHASGNMAELLASLPASRHSCRVPLVVAREHGCPLASSLPVDLTERRSERSAAQELEMEEEILRGLIAAVERAEESWKTAETATAEARRANMRAENVYDQKWEQLLEERSLLGQAERLIAEAEQSWDNTRRLTADLQRIDAELENSRAGQELLRREVSDARTRLSETFQYAVRAILGDEVDARIDFSGRKLSPVVEHHGVRESAALATVKLLAFDLAALTASVEGRGHFPGFLIHDAPREADLAANVYERLFLYARHLEKAVDGEPGFQYIVTTTTPPPERFRQEPWIRLTLSGTPADERLLRMDL